MRASAANRNNLTDWQHEVMGAFRSQRYVHDQIDVQPGYQWDSISLEPGQTFHDGLRMFDLPIGTPLSSGRAKSYADTSMYKGNTFVAPEAFAIRRVLFTFSKTASEVDIFSIVEAQVWRLHLGRKMYLGSPMISLQQTELTKAPIRICEYCRAVYVQESSCPGCGARDFQLSSVGGGMMSGLAFYMDLPKGSELPIENEEYFYVNFSGESYTVRNRLKMWCHFEGLHARPIR